MGGTPTTAANRISWRRDRPAAYDRGTMSLISRIHEAAAGPKAAQTDMGKVDQQPLPDLIAADQYLRGVAAAEELSDAGGPVSGWGMLRMARAIPPDSQ